MRGNALRQAARPPLEFDVDGDITLYPSDGDRAVVLNRTASDIWRLLAEPLAFEDLLAELASAYGVEAAAIEADVRSVVETLIEQRVVVSEQSAPPDT